MFLRLWQFRATPGHETEFEAAYGPGGAWARLFLKGAGYLGTELLRDATGLGDYVTIDRWESESAWTSFHEQYGDEYESLDRACERLCNRDARIGEFVRADEQSTDAHMKTSTQVAGLAGWVALSVVAGAVGAFASADAGSFYEQLQRPTWAPPAWLFAPVWSVLYLMMGVAAWLVWRESDRADTRVASTLYVAQLAANALWTWLFFAGGREPGRLPKSSSCWS